MPTLQKFTPECFIQQISGHRTLSALQKYLEVLDEDLEAAVDTLVF